MLSIFVLEDELLQQSRIENVINELIAQKSLQCKPPKIFGKPHQLVEAITERGSHQLFFLDIEIKGEEKKGLDIAKEIRKKDPNATIVFVTTHSEFMPITFKYKVAALDFIDKSLSEEEFAERICSAIEYTIEKAGTTVSEEDATAASFGFSAASAGLTAAGAGLATGRAGFGADFFASFQAASRFSFISSGLIPNFSSKISSELLLPNSRSSAVCLWLTPPKNFSTFTLR